MKQKVAVIGLGYVGLPLAVAAAECDFEVIGIDINKTVVKSLNLGVSSIEDVSNIQLANVLKNGKFTATTSYDELKNIEYFVICVPTPLTESRRPDLSYLESAARSIARVLSKGCLVILESTVEPGTTRDFLLPILMGESGLNTSEFELAFSPERIDPGNPTWNLQNTPKIVSGLTPKAKTRAMEFYSSFVSHLIESNSVEVAEVAKLLENSYRLINISFINEFSEVCEKLGVEANEVIQLASSKPYGFMEFYPSLGVGGHCIPVDPLYLTHRANLVGSASKFIDLAFEVNDNRPKYFVLKAEKVLKGLNQKKILVIGVAYKSNTSDTRETPAKSLILQLRQKGAKVFWHDDLVKQWNHENSTPLGVNFDLAILVTPHDYLDLTSLGDIPMLNTRMSL
jgi:UDP-N-acetyl-D-glucosamine dehydrogenase